MAFTDFLANNYLWFLVVTLILVFALIGYFVDQNGQKMGVSKINKVDLEKDKIAELERLAQNKALGETINNQKVNMGNIVNNMNSDNRITDLSMPELNKSDNTSQVGFDVLTK